MDNITYKHLESYLISFFLFLSKMFGILTFLIGCVVLFGWFSHIAILKSFFPDIVTMKFNTALCFILLGFSLWLLQMRDNGKITIATARACLVVVFIIVILTAFEYIFRTEIGIDEFFFPEDPNPVFTVHAGRMAIHTLVSFILIASALFLLSKRKKVGCCLAQSFCILPLIISVFSIIGYIYGVKFFYFSGYGFTPMAIPTAVAVFLISAGTFFVCLDAGFARIFVSSGVGGLIARSLIPVAIFVPPMLGFLKIWTEKKGFIVNELGVAFVAMSNMVVLGSCVVGLSFFIDYIETKRRKGSEKLADLSLRHRAILSAVPDIIMEVDMNKIYTWANDAGYKFFGDDVIGKEAGSYFEGLQDTYGIVKPLFNGQDDIVYVESWQRRRDGQKRLLAWWCRTLKNENGVVVGALSTARDITEIKKSEDERIELEAQLMQSEKMAGLGQLSASLSHELSSPLMGLITILESYHKRAFIDSEEEMEIRKMLEALEYMKDVIINLNAFARSEEKVKVAKVNINDIIDSTLLFAKPLLDLNNINLVKDYASGISPILGDWGRLQHVVVNVIANAKDAMSKGGELVITTKNSLDKNNVILEFKDNGLGISKEDLGRIFIPFFTTKKSGEGLGLGLVIIRDIVKSHGGKISVDSELGKGTKIIIELPSAGVKNG